MNTTVTLAEALQIAVRHHQAGQRDEAARIYRQILAAAPGFPDALHLCGVLAHQEGRHDEAVQLIERAIAAQPDQPGYRCNLAQALLALGRPAAAIEHLRAALDGHPAHPGAWNNLGLAQRAAGQPGAAEHSFRRAAECQTPFPEAHNNLGVTLLDLNRPSEAANALRSALAQRPAYPEAHNNLGLALRRSGDVQGAVQAYREALELRADYPEAAANLAVALAALGRHAEAIVTLRSTLADHPEYAAARYNLGLLLLLQGEYGEGLECYAARFAGGGADPATRARAARLSVLPAWEGGELSGKSLFLWAEQGLGDTLMMLRYLPLVAARRPQRLVLACDGALARLAARIPGIDAVVDSDADPQEQGCDCQCPLLSLPRSFASRLDKLPATVPYLTVPAELRTRWRERLAALPGRKIGLVWAGNPAFANDAARSIALDAFAPLARLSGISLVSLQKGAAAQRLQDLPWKIHDPMDECVDFLDSAALIDNLDLVIGVDTAVIHLAAALGRPTWLLNRFESEWRWLLEREDSPWYPTLRIFRQAAPGRWEETLAAVAAELAGST